MRTFLIVSGVITISAYAIFGGFMMNVWAVVAASEVPLETVITDMEAVGESYAPMSGFVFAALGIGLALLWALLVVKSGKGMRVWEPVMLWALILALGAVAYFVISFGNLNAVGDTYADWNMEAAWKLERPLYLISLAALGIAIAAPITSFAINRRRQKSAAPPHGSNETSTQI